MCVLHPRFHRLLLILKCLAKSPTTPLSNDLRTPIGDRVLIVVTSDSERFVTVDVSNAQDPAFIRECIFTKVSEF